MSFKSKKKNQKIIYLQKSHESLIFCNHAQSDLHLSCLKMIVGRIKFCPELGSGKSCIYFFKNFHKYQRTLI